MSKLIYNRPGLGVIITPRAIYIEAHTFQASTMASDALRHGDSVAWQRALIVSTLCKQEIAR